VDIDGRDFGDILSAPFRYSGNGTISYARGLPVVEGREVVVVSDRGAIRGVYRGFWKPGETRGIPLDERIRTSRDLSRAARMHFVEVSSPGRSPVIVAIDGGATSIRIFSTERPSR
jgi:hypothetical protein